jgi:hypothetical protein
MPVKRKASHTVWQEQLSLFDGFLSAEPNQSRTLDIWDALPKFVLSHSRDGDGANLMEFNNVKIDGQPIRVEIAAAVLSREVPPGAPDAARIGQWVFPGVREELVERALRKMAVQRQIEATLDADEKQRPIFPIVFTLSQLRAELAAAGHDMKISQLREALYVLGNSTLRAEGLIDDELHGFSHPLLLISYKRRDDDITGEKSIYVARFHPLAVRAILAGAWQSINYARVMSLGLPLARWIATRMNNASGVLPSMAR